MKRVAVLVSGGGTNLQALLESEQRGENPNVAIEPQVMERMAESFRLAGEAPALVTQSVQAEKVTDLAAFLADFSRQHGLGSVTVTGVSDEQGMAYLQQLKAAGYQGALPESIWQGGSYRFGMDQTRLRVRYEWTTLSVEMTLMGETRRVMTDEELAQLNDYHRQVYATVSPLLDAEEQAWLAEATAPLTR